MRKRHWMWLLLALSCRSPSEPEPHGMLFRAYDERMQVQTGEAGTGDLAVRTASLIIDGYGRTVRAERYIGPTDYESQALAFDYHDGSTQGTDPDRMRRLTELSVVNTDNQERTLFFLVQYGGGAQQRVYQCTLAVRDALWYTPESGWVIYNADGTRKAETAP